MRCRYRFKIIGQLKLKAKCPIPSRRVTYELETNDAGVVRYITATVPASNEDEWPRVTKNPKPGVALDINIPSPWYPLVRHELRIAEGLLSLYGLESIDLENPEQEWLPDSDAERDRLRLFSFQSSPEQISDAELEPITFSLIAQSLLAAWDAQNIEVPMSFYRKGRIDSRERRYIEAIYDFYFVLETIYGEGKTKNYQIKEVFKQNQKLLSLIQQALSDKFFHATLHRGPKLLASFNSTYNGKSPEEVIDHIVALRGFLHHHAARRPDIWHPEDHQRFEIDALVLERIAFAVVFELASEFVFSKKTVDAYHEILEVAQTQKTIQIISGD